MSELKPCPFCGGKGEIEYGAKNALCDKVDHPFVRCIKCKGGWKPLNEWQSRPTEDLLTAENERLKNVIDVLELEAKCYREDRNNFFTVNQQLRWVLRELAYCTSYCSEEDAAYIIETVEEALKEGE